MKANMTNSYSWSLFTYVEQQALDFLRDRYQLDRDRFSGRELAHLTFLTWLYLTGRLEP